MEKQNNNFGIVFHLFCPANPTIFDEPMIMFKNGTMKDDLNFRLICPLKQKEQTSRITYRKNDLLIHIYPNTEELRERFIKFLNISSQLQNLYKFFATLFCKSTI